MRVGQRVVAVWLSSVLVSLAAVGAMALLRESQWRARLVHSEAEGPRLAWAATVQGPQQRLQARLEALAELLPPGSAALAGAEQTPATAHAAATPWLIDDAARQGLHQADLYDPGRHRIASSQVDAVPLLDAASQLALPRDGRARTGVSLPDREHALLVAARRLADGRVIAVGADLAPLVQAISASLGQPLALRTPRGRVIVGPRDAAVTHTLVELQTIEGRPVATLDRRVDAAAAAGGSPRIDLRLGLAFGLAFIVFVGGVAFAVRRATAPLARGVTLVEAIGAGQLQAGPDDADQLLPGEAGRLARAAEALRTELRSLGALREERLRVAQQQERLMREQLRHLAETLDPSARDEVLRQLAPGEADDGESQLARLAQLMARMTTLVSHQQERLLQLLRELQSSMKSRELLASLQQELQIARDLQQAILPRRSPPTQAATLQATMIAAHEVGGDFYDWFMLDERRLAVVVADVSGKGVPAAFFMAVTRTLLRSGAAFVDDPAALIARLNDQLAAENEQTMFVTLFYGVLELDSGRLRHVNAGHNPPLLRRADGRVQWLPRGRNPVLAAIAGMEFRLDEVSLARGDGLLLYTDGITEAADAQGRLFGEPALAEVLRAAGPEPVAPLVQAVRRFEDGSAQADDITCVWLRYEGRP